jgi:multiple sugar transport system substrate-binding protein
MNPRLHTVSAIARLGVVVAFVVAGCGSSSSSPQQSSAAPSTGEATATAAGSATPAAASKTQCKGITLWARSDTSPFMQPLVDAYNATGAARVELTVVPAGAAFTQKLGAALATGTAPDVISLNLVYAPYFASKGQLADITSRANDLGYVNKLNASELQLGTWNNEIYALPFTGDASALFYNKTLFKKAGLDPSKPPTTWAEIKDAAKKISALGGGVSGYYFPGSGSGWNLFTFTPFIWASGGDVLTGEGANQKSNLNTQPVKDALAFYRDLWTSGVIDPSAQTDDGSQILTLFEAGKVGMLANGAFAYSEFKSKFPNLDYGITPIPGKDGGQASFAGGDTITITGQTKCIDQAWDFVKWTTTVDVQTKYIAGAGVVPIRADAVPAAAGPNFTTLVAAMAMGKTPKSVVYSQLFEDPTGPWATMIHDSVFNGTIDQQVSAADAAWNSIIAAGAK